MYFATLSLIQIHEFHSADFSLFHASTKERKAHIIKEVWILFYFFHLELQ